VQHPALRHRLHDGPTTTAPTQIGHHEDAPVALLSFVQSRLWLAHAAREGLKPREVDVVRHVFGDVETSVQNLIAGVVADAGWGPRDQWDRVMGLSRSTASVATRVRMSRLPPGRVAVTRTETQWVSVATRVRMSRLPPCRVAVTRTETRWAARRLWLLWRAVATFALNDFPKDSPLRLKPDASAHRVLEASVAAHAALVGLAANPIVSPQALFALAPAETMERYMPAMATIYWTHC
jgi:hypothetical protein